MSYRILISDPISPEGIEALERNAEVIQADINEFHSDIDAVIVRSRTKLDRETLTRFSPRLRVVGRAGVGLDNIDLDAARELNITVLNTPEATSLAVAEHTLGLMLAVARHIPQANASMKKGDWEKSTFTGSSLSGRTLGIIGVGKIGSALAHIVQGLRMKVIGTDAYKSDDYLRAQGVKPSEFNDLLGQADFISLHVPLNEDTRGMIGKDELNKTKPGAFLISTARGGIVDERALLRALKDEKLAGAALDVFEIEPPGRTELVKHPKVIVTPHIAAQTKDAQSRTSVDIANMVINELSS